MWFDEVQKKAFVYVPPEIVICAVGIQDVIFK